MNQVKEILQFVAAYLGSATTIYLAWFNTDLVAGVKDSVAIMVGLATLILTVFKCIELYRRLFSKTKKK